MIERRGGSVVWVLRQNGTWWPGRILCSNEIPTSGILSRTNFSSRFPIKLLGRDDASVYALSSFFSASFVVYVLLEVRTWDS